MNASVFKRARLSAAKPLTAAHQAKLDKFGDEKGDQTGWIESCTRLKFSITYSLISYGMTQKTSQMSRFLENQEKTTVGRDHVICECFFEI